MDKYQVVPIIGKLQRVVLASSKFELSDQFQPLNKGVISIETSLETGWREDTLAEYFAAVVVTIKGKDNQEAVKENFVASCRMIGFYSAEGNIQMSEDEFAETISKRGALQIFPLARSHLLNLTRANGIRLKIPMELDLDGMVTKHATDESRQVRKPGKRVAESKTRRGKKG